jgi:hypothetical protein
MAKAKKPTDGAKTPRKPRAKKGTNPFTKEQAPTWLEAIHEEPAEPRIIQQADGKWTNTVELQYLTDDEREMVAPTQLALAEDAISIQGAPITDNLLGPNEFIPKKKHQVGLGWFPDMDPEKRFRLLKHYEEHGNFGNLLPEHQTPGKTEPSEPTQFPPKALTTPEETSQETNNTTIEGSEEEIGNQDGSQRTLKTGTQARKHSEATTSETDSKQTPQTESIDKQTGQGDEIVAVAETAAVYCETKQNTAIPSRARMPGESRPSYWESMRKTARAAGLPRGQGPGTAYEWATMQAEREYAAEIAPPDPEPIEAPPEPEPVQSEPAAPTIVDKLDELGAPTTVDKPPADQGVSGLGEIPADWPQLPSNASLQVEIAWVSANRLRVRSGHGVDLSRALSPAPSYSALSWLETSILFPSKFADISVKATASQDDEKEHIRREKMAIEEIRGLLAEMLE